MARGGERATRKSTTEWVWLEGTRRSGGSVRMARWLRIDSSALDREQTATRQVGDVVSVRAGGRKGNGAEGSKDCDPRQGWCDDPQMADRLLREVMRG